MARSRSSRRGAVSPVASLPPTCAAMISAVVGAVPGSVVWGRVASIVIAGRSFDAGGRGRYSSGRSPVHRRLAGVSRTRCRTAPPGVAAGCRGPAEVGLSGTARMTGHRGLSRRLAGCGLRDVSPRDADPADATPATVHAAGSGPGAATGGRATARDDLRRAERAASRSSRTGCRPRTHHRRRPRGPRASPTAARAGPASAPARRRRAARAPPNRASTTSPSCSAGDIDGPRTATRRQRT